MIPFVEVGHTMAWEREQDQRYLTVSSLEG